MSHQIIQGECREVLATLPDQSVHCIVTSPPYFGLRDYGVDGQIGLEQTPDAYIAEIVAVFREARRVLRDDGTFWLNIGDSYAVTTRGSGGKSSSGLYRDGRPEQSRLRSAAITLEHRNMNDRRARVPVGLKAKDLLMIPARVALALQADGWYLRSEIVWHKPNPIPESAKDRPTSAHEMVYLFAKSPRYFYDAEAVKEPCTDVRSVGRRSAINGLGNGELANGARFGGGETGRNLRNVWTITPKPYKGAHFAVMPTELAETCIKAGCPEGGVVLDPFAGVGTTGVAAVRLKRNSIGIELSSEHAKAARERIEREIPMMQWLKETRQTFERRA
jgi:DNA modification methylase